jgi:predicted ester cyclase
MGESQAVDAVRAAVVALNDGDVDGYLSYFAPSCGRWAPGFAQPLTLTEIRDGFVQLRDAFEALHLHEDLLFGDQRFVCARWRLQGVHAHDYLGVAPSGRPIDVETCEVYEVDGGRVVVSWVYGDVIGQLVEQICGEAGPA